MRRCPSKNSPEFWGHRDDRGDSAAANGHSRRQDATFSRNSRGCAFLARGLPGTDIPRPPRENPSSGRGTSCPQGGASSSAPGSTILDSFTIRGSPFTLHAPSHARPFLCGESGSRGLRHPDGSGTARPQPRANHHSLHPCLERGRRGREKPRGQPVRKKAMRIMRKPNKTSPFANSDPKPLEIRGLSERYSSVLSGCKTRRRVYMETV